MKGQARVLRLLGGIFGAVGLVFLGFAIALAVSSAVFHASAERTEGRVVAYADGMSLRSLCPVVEYAVEGRSYSFEHNVCSSSPSLRIGEDVPVAYDPANPSEAGIPSFGAVYGPALGVGGGGILFTTIGAVPYVLGRRKLKQQAWFRTHGREVWARIAHVAEDTSMRINGRHPYVLHTKWTDVATGRTHVATSDRLHHDPRPVLQGRTHVRVLFDPADPERNHVDLEMR
jgi:hypothetical protein